MQVGVVGINHKSADLQLRELLAKACQKRFCPGGFAHGERTFVLLSTCNRTEIYFSADDLAETHSYILHVLRYDVPVEFEHRLYSYFGYDCFTHLCRVTVGMDSAIIAETEIQGQVKKAYEAASLHRVLPQELHFMFQKCLKIGKEIRTAFPSTRGIPALEDAILHLASSQFDEVHQSRVLFVGISEINGKILSMFKEKKFQHLFLCNRTESKARDFASKENITHIPWNALASWYHYDLILFGTKSPDYLINRGSIPGSSINKKLIIDLSVPRNVEPTVGKHSAISLFNVDQVNQHVEKIRHLKTIEVNQIEKWLVDLTDKQIRTYKRKQHLRLYRSLELEPKVIALGV